jgi:two-component system response regulator (stage 0 sporulation protein F)
MIMGSKEKILYIDDEPINLFLFERLFDKNFHVITALSGPEGLEKLSMAGDIKVVVSDMKMPQMSGLDFIELAKQRYPNLYCFILTGYDITAEISSALNRKLILKYFRKPFNEAEIRTAIHEVVRASD